MTSPLSLILVNTHARHTYDLADANNPGLVHHGLAHARFDIRIMYLMIRYQSSEKLICCWTSEEIIFLASLKA